jgi:hypothetical protein
MGELRRERAVVSALSVVFLSSSLLADVRAVEPTPSPAKETPDPAWRADGARVVEREAVALGIPSEGGTSLAGEALDPSVDLRGTPTIEGLPADVTPAEATELTGWRNEHSRSILNPDGTITAAVLMRDPKTTFPTFRLADSRPRGAGTALRASSAGWRRGHGERLGLNEVGRSRQSSAAPRTCIGITRRSTDLASRPVLQRASSQST